MLDKWHFIEEDWPGSRHIVGAQIGAIVHLMGPSMGFGYKGFAQNVTLLSAKPLALGVRTVGAQEVKTGTIHIEGP